MSSKKGNSTGPRKRTRFLRLGGILFGALAVGAAVEAAMLSLQAAHSVVHPPRTRDDKSPADFGLAYESVEFYSTDGILLRGWFIPGGEAAVIMAHGHGGSKASMLPRANALRREAGYSVLLFDFRASGESEGSQATLGYREQNDVLGAIAYLQSRPEVDPERIGALGSSMGAAALLMLGEKAHVLRAIVADSAFADAGNLIDNVDRWFRLPPFFFSRTIPWAVERWVSLRASDVVPQAAVGRIAPTAVFIIHGAEDDGVSVSDAYALLEAAQEPKELWIVPEAGHGQGSEVAQEEYRDRVLGFFERYLGTCLRTSVQVPSPLMEEG